MGNKSKYLPFLWSGVIFIVCFGLMLLAVYQEQQLIQTENITVPTFSGSTDGVPGSAGLENVPEAVNVDTTGPVVLYFFGMAALIGLILFFIPVSKLKHFLRILFGFAFAWGIFVYLAFFLNPIVAAVPAVAVGLAWLLVPRVWLHNALLLLTLVSLGAVFGALFSPWTVIAIMLIIAIYDYVSVRFGYMQWMAKRLGQSDTLPAFFIPSSASDWKMSIKGPQVREIFDEKEKKEFSILGGGDIFFPLWLAATVWFAAGLNKALIMGAFTVLGLGAVYVIHFYFQKGKPTPALPALFVACLLGLLLITFVLPKRF
jgi:presenilin-like A22 family membrane protease